MKLSDITRKFWRYEDKEVVWQVFRVGEEKRMQEFTDESAAMCFADELKAGNPEVDVTVDFVTRKSVTLCEPFGFNSMKAR